MKVPSVTYHPVRNLPKTGGNFGYPVARFLGCMVLSMLILELFAVSCTPISRQLDYRMPATIEEHNAYLTAPIVLVGLIRKDEVAGPVTASRWERAIALRLHRITVAVDVYLRGNLHRNNVVVYYFKFAGSYDGPAPLGYWNRDSDNDKGLRRIFFLREDNGLLRLVCDGKNTCTIPVGSGSHSNLSNTDHDVQPLESAIAEVLFSKGQGVSDHEFASSFSTSVNYVDEKFSVPKLKAFVQSADADIRRAACFCFRSDLNSKYMQNDQEIKAICQKKNAE